MQKNRSHIINLGCRLNIYEGEVIKSLVSKSKLSQFTIINSCTVTQEAEKKTCYEIRKAKKNSPKNKIVLILSPTPTSKLIYGGLIYYARGWRRIASRSVLLYFLN